jgi:DNA-binding MarR family transcriptional regulator
MSLAFTSTLGVIANRADIEKLQGQQLVTLYNELTGENLKRFADKKSGQVRLDKAFEIWKKQQRGVEVPADATEIKTYRPESNRGKVIELASRAGGASFKELMELTKWDASELSASLSRIETYNGLTVKVEGEGDDRRVIVSGVLRTRKAFDFKPKKEQRGVKAETKRAKVLEMLLKGATFDEVKEANQWDQRTTYEGIRLIHGYVGYGLRETAEGKIQAYTN